MRKNFIHPGKRQLSPKEILCLEDISSNLNNSEWRVLKTKNEWVISLRKPIFLNSLLNIPPINMEKAFVYDLNGNLLKKTYSRNNENHVILYDSEHLFGKRIC